MLGFIPFHHVRQDVLLGKGPDGIFNNREVGKVCTMHGFICCGNIQNDADVKKVCSETVDNIVKMELSNLKIALIEHAAMNKMKHSQRQSFIIADQLAQEKKNTFVSN